MPPYDLLGLDKAAPAAVESAIGHEVVLSRAWFEGREAWFGWKIDLCLKRGGLIRPCLQTRVFLSSLSRPTKKVGVMSANVNTGAALSAGVTLD